MTIKKGVIILDVLVSIAIVAIFMSFIFSYVGNTTKSLSNYISKNTMTKQRQILFGYLQGTRNILGYEQLKGLLGVQEGNFDLKCANFVRNGAKIELIQLPITGVSFSDLTKDKTEIKNMLTQSVKLDSMMSDEIGDGKYETIVCYVNNGDSIKFKTFIRDTKVLITEEFSFFINGFGAKEIKEANFDYTIGN